MNSLNIISQHTYHADAQIIGTNEALIVLRDAISDALKQGKAEIDMFASDGEGYTLIIRKLEPVEFNDLHPCYEKDQWFNE